jgi:hypothetical protein
MKYENYVATYKEIYSIILENKINLSIQIYLHKSPSNSHTIDEEI